MTISIRYKKERAVKLALKPHDDRVEHLVKTWSDATLKHCFDGRGKFQKAVQSNREVLRSRGKKFVIRDNYRQFFKKENFVFSTKADGREETLYFDDGRRTGRLRQQHGGGPLAKIDHHRRIRLFFPQDRLNALSGRHMKRPAFCRVELKPSDGTHLIEFEWDGVSIEKCHASGGRVSTNRKKPSRRIDQALQNILGIPSAPRKP